MISGAYLGAPKARVHEGFNEALRDLVDNGDIVEKVAALCEKLDAKRDRCMVVLTGHYFRGAILSQFLAAYLTHSGWGNIAGGFAHQGPKPGDQAFKTYYEDTLGLGPRTIRLYHKRDLISGYEFPGVKIATQGSASKPSPARERNRKRIGTLGISWTTSLLGPC
jgi:hypothetical protein